MPFVYQDFETQSDLDLSITGTLKYVLDVSTRALLWSWAIDDDPLKLWCPDLSRELVPEVWTFVKGRMDAIGECPAEVVEALKRDDTYIVGWNEAFDRQVWQQVQTDVHDWPMIGIEQTLDAMAQASASNLPGRLDMAGRVLGLGQKTVGGKSVMLRFADTKTPLPGSPADIDAMMAKGMSRQKAIEAAIEMWDLYLTYSVQDTNLMRDVFKTTRPLDGTEWQEYWAFERINDRGLGVDLDVCKGAMAYREEEAEYVVQQIKDITKGKIAGPTFTKQINEWIFERLPDDLREFMVKARDDEGNVTRVTGSKDVMGRLLEEIAVSDAPPDEDVIDLLEVLQYGRASSSIKFEKMHNQAVNTFDSNHPGSGFQGDRLTGSYVFNGAGQTGRGSSRGVQIHNLPRDKLPNELDVLDMLAAGTPIEELRKLPLNKKDVEKDKRGEPRGETAVSAILSRLIRPTFIAPEGRSFVWGDWSAIEARVNPWLAKSRAAERAVLEPFRASDADKSVPDVYVYNAESIVGVGADVIWERYKNGDTEAYNWRQSGKVSVLALGFLGGVGALKAMAKNYGMRLTNEEAQHIVDAWRDRNGWARSFGVACEEAAFSAIDTPMAIKTAGRLKYQFAPDLMGGTLVCFLPDMRPIVYPKARISKIEKFGHQQDAITYLNGMGYRSLWRGLLVENNTQGTAASILRQTLVRIEERYPDTTVGHTHDEVITEVDNDEVKTFSERLESVMVEGFDWTEGLPLAAEVVSDWYYHK